ncbi:prephenate dehydratase [Bacillus zhangzhouensis]|uniref:Prephenate dehydratase n=1 Tax=Bacillus zhangzhouensis TaxID=1178540 RepID=A0A081LB93_9BACI|nr:prephenate dehydratase [Bacillus zhangzhouensis]KEP26519.1 prephenate dehydratase [Bacillus zhangzhouensis]
MKQLTVGYFGPEATFTHLAVCSCFPKDAVQRAYATIPQCMDAVSKGEVDLAVVPLENALEGSVNLTIDYLIHEEALSIVGEMTAPIRQHLLVHPSRAESWETLDVIQSHPHAIAQCHQFLKKHYPDIPHRPVESTGYAAKYISEHPDEAAGAIANEIAAKTYGLTIAKKDIHDYPHNHTRFVILHKDPKASFPMNSGFSSKPKTTIVVSLPKDDQSGALHRVLSAFSWRNLNLSKIESRPTKTGLGHYLFIIDIEKEMDDVLVPGAIQELEAIGCEVKLLGSYQTYELTNEK